MQHRFARTQAMGAARAGTLLVSLLVSAPIAAQEPALAPPAPGKGSTTIDAASIETVSDLELYARGSVELRRDDTTINTESLKYNREFGLVEAEGDVRLKRGGDRFAGLRLRYNTEDDTGVFEQPTYLIERRGIARGKAERVEFLGKDRLKLDKTTFTTCTPGNDDWLLEVDELELDYESEEAHAKSPRIRLLDTTIAALPFATLPLENRRKSGFLAPHYAHSTLRGAEISVPYYWNIAPEQDATLTPVYMRKRGEQLKTNYRYLGRSFAGDLRVDYTPNDRELETYRYNVAFLHQNQFTPNLSGQLNWNRVSDYRYFTDFSTQVQQVTVGSVSREGFLNYNGALGAWSYNAVTRVQTFQFLQDPADPKVPPYHRVPQLGLTAVRNDLGGFADLTVPVEYVQFTHPTLVEGARSTAKPSVALPVLAPGWYLTPKLGVHHGNYVLSRTGPAQPDRQSISIPWMSLDTGLAFDRDASWFGERVTQTFEPRIFYVYAPYRDQNLIPVFDTGLNDFNYAQIFTENRFSGGDRFGDADEVTLAATTRVLAAGGQETFRATLGQRIYFKDEEIGLTPSSPLRTNRASDILGSIGGRISRNWIFDATVQYNNRDRQSERYGTMLRYSPEIAKVLNIGSRYNRTGDPRVHQVEISGQWPTFTGWYAVGRVNYSLIDRRLLEGLWGLEYNGGCWVFRGVVQRIQALTDITSTAIYLQLEFNGLGQIGMADATTLLKRGVPGYSVTNPRDPTLAPPSLPSQAMPGQLY
jgi:LPS-assembly protein